MHSIISGFSHDFMLIIGGSKTAAFVKCKIYFHFKNANVLLSPISNMSVPVAYFHGYSNAHY